MKSLKFWRIELLKLEWALPNRAGFGRRDPAAGAKKRGEPS